MLKANCHIKPVFKYMSDGSLRGLETGLKTIMRMKGIRIHSFICDKQTLSC